MRDTAETRGWKGFFFFFFFKKKKKKKESAQKVDPEEENSPDAPVGTRTRDISITSPARYH